jgi:uncharacterized protein
MRARVLGSGGVVVCTNCDVADRMIPRLRGLLGRSELRSGEGLLISPCPSVHTFFMRFSIDVVFLDREKAIVDIAQSVRPWRAAGARGAAAALELPAGTAGKLGLQVGDVLTIEGP